MDAGKVKAVGISECTVEQAKTLQAVVPVSAIEIEWNLFNRESEACSYSLHSSLLQDLLRKYLCSGQAYIPAPLI